MKNLHSFLKIALLIPIIGIIVLLFLKDTLDSDSDENFALGQYPFWTNVLIFYHLIISYTLIFILIFKMS